MTQALPTMRRPAAAAPPTASTLGAAAPAWTAPATSTSFEAIVARATPKGARLVFRGRANPGGISGWQSYDIGTDGLYRYVGWIGSYASKEPSGATSALMLVAHPPVPNTLALPIVHYFFDVVPLPAASLGQPPPRAVGHAPMPGVAMAPYDGTPDRPYPPSGVGWFETTYDDQAARTESASLLGELPASHYVDKLLPTGLYRFFGFEGADGSTSVGALRYWGEIAASSLGADPNIPAPGSNPNSDAVFVAAQNLLTSISQNGCINGFDPAVLAFQKAYNASGIGPTVTEDGFYGSNAQAALQVVLDSVTPPAGDAPAWCVGPRAGGGAAAPAPPAGAGATGAGAVRIPGITIQGSDFYDTLTVAQQGAFRAALFAQISPATCPGLDFSTLSSADGLVDPGNRSGATGCFQLAHVVGTTAGVLDAPTYQAIMAAKPPGLQQASMMGGGTIAAVAVAALAVTAGVGIAVVTGHNPFLMWKH